MIQNHKHHTHHVLSSDSVVQGAGKRITIVFVLNIVFAALEFIFGAMFGSVAIMSDAVHDTGDAIAVGFAWFFEKISRKKSDKSYTLGYRRFSLLGALITSVILLTGSILVIIEGFPRLIHPAPVESSGMFFLAIFAILANSFGAYLMTRGSSRNESLLNLHMLEDVLGWVAVLLVSVVIHFKPWYWLDPLLSLAISIFILTQAIPKFIGTLRILMEAAPETVNAVQLLAELEAQPEIGAMTELCIWSIDGEKHAAMLHMTILTSDQAHAKIVARQILAHHQVAFSAIEIDENTHEHDHHSEN
ncbi:cation diffusion facilitator family transporter [Lactococcus insecticola]|uniref:Cation transporter n=1 Tax=Pseudolactococcus insecticola TaxID=2709158 RepID=A0A6A0B2T6_9LACT|nr:cation diffusion facilitator family transporter [Lactococcus insecticola]GFH39629.1 cation transporter [Lactococcus insecticola]